MATLRLLVLFPLLLAMDGCQDRATPDHSRLLIYDYPQSGLGLLLEYDGTSLPAHLDDVVISADDQASDRVSFTLTKAEVVVVGQPTLRALWSGGPDWTPTTGGGRMKNLKVPFGPVGMTCYEDPHQPAGFPHELHVTCYGGGPFILRLVTPQGPITIDFSQDKSGHLALLGNPTRCIPPPRLHHGP
jgi:hypothetical protein